jgi:hypothetical protein
MGSEFEYLLSFLKQPLNSLFWASIMVFVFLPYRARNLVYQFSIHIFSELDWKQTVDSGFGYPRFL